MVSCSLRPGIARNRDALRVACRGAGATPVAAPAAPSPSRKPFLLSHPPASSHPAFSPRPRVAAVRRSSVRGFWTPGKDRVSKTRALKFTLAATMALIPTVTPCARVAHSRLSRGPTPVVLCRSSTHHVSGILSRCRPMVGYLHRGVVSNCIPCVLFEGPARGSVAQRSNRTLTCPNCRHALGSYYPTAEGKEAVSGAHPPESDVCGLPITYPATHKGSRRVTPGPVSLSAIHLRLSSCPDMHPLADKARCSGTGPFVFLDPTRGNQAPRRCRHTPVPPQDTPQDGLAQAARPSVTPHPGGPASTPAAPTPDTVAHPHPAPPPSANAAPSGESRRCPRGQPPTPLRSLSPDARAAMTASTRTGRPRVTRATLTGTGPELDAKRPLGSGERQSDLTVGLQLQRSNPATNRKLRTTRAHETNGPAYGRSKSTSFNPPSRIGIVIGGIGIEWPCGLVIGSLDRRQSGCGESASCESGYDRCQYTAWTTAKFSTS